MADSNVNTPCNEYNAMAERWQLIDDLLGGTKQMRHRGEKYLPKQRLEDKEDYAAKLKLAVLYNGLGQAIDDATNRPFSKAVTFEGVEDLKDEQKQGLEELLADIDGAGTSADEQLRESFRTAAKYGKVHLLVDYTTVGDNATRADEMKLGARPTIVMVDPRNVIGWRSQKRGSTRVLTEVRIRETSTTVEDDWSEKTENIVRVVTPESVTVWREKKDVNGKTEWQPDAPVPMLKNGKPLDQVPLFTAYFDREGFMTSCPPYEDLAFLNIAHWQSTAAQRYAAAFARIAVMFTTGHKPKADTTSNDAPKEIKVTPASFLSFPEADANVRFAEQTGAAIKVGVDELRSLEEQMQTLGIRPFVERSAASTATGKSIDESRDMSIGQRWIRTLERIWRDALAFACDWAAKPLPDDFEVRIFSDFVLPASQTDLNTIQAARSAGDLSRETYLKELQRRSTLSPELDIKEEMARIDAEGPPLGDLTFGGSGRAGGQDGDATGDAPAGGEDDNSGGAGAAGGVAA